MLILAPLVLVVLVVAVVAAATGAARGQRRSLFGGAGPPLVLLAGAGLVVMLAAAGLLVGGLRGGGYEAEERPGAEAAAAPKPPAAEEDQPGPETQNDEAEEPGVPSDGPLPGSTGPSVQLRAGGPWPVVDRLPDRAVLDVTARRFRPGAAGRAAQCRSGKDGPEGCVGQFPVQFDERGGARFQYLVVSRARQDAGCGPGRPPCLLVVADDGPGRAVAFTVFGEAAPPPGRVEVEPRTGLADGAEVSVRANGFPPGTRLLVAQCPLAGEPCRATVVARTGGDGRAVTQLEIRSGGRGGSACGPRQACTVRVTADAPVPPVSVLVRFAAALGVRYDGGRLAAGLALAALLLALAWRLVQTSDWRGPREAATPEMDRAVLDA